MQTRYPKGNAIFTAEFLPDVGESGTARYIPLELTPASINNDMLTYYQHYASEGILSACMFNYTEWIQKKYLLDEDKFVKLLGEKFNETRLKLNKLLAEKKMIIRDRLVDDLVSLYMGYEFMLDFFVDKNVCNKESKNDFLGMFTDILIDMQAGVRHRQSLISRLINSYAS
ncbi:MAG: hypothetical protein MJ168_05615 [Clostridia bacterium]|nr:hypothetical protein [Clostridia bacterium]